MSCGRYREVSAFGVRGRRDSVNGSTGAVADEARVGIEVDESRRRLDEFSRGVAPEDEFDLEAACPKSLNEREIVAVACDEDEAVAPRDGARREVHGFDGEGDIDLLLAVLCVPLEEHGLKARGDCGAEEDGLLSECDPKSFGRGSSDALPRRNPIRRWRSSRNWKSNRWCS
jgi:hypothetical protein